MSSEEGMSMAKMAVTALLVVLVIGAVVTMVYMAYNWFVSGTDNMSNKVNSVAESELSSFDCNIYTGAQVLSTLEKYKTESIAIAVSNKANLGANPSAATVQSVAAIPSATVYCAQLADVGNGADGFVRIPVNDKKSRYEVTGFAGAGSQPTMNTDFHLTKSVNDANHYINESAKFYCNLIYSSGTDAVVGLYFKQIPN